MPLYTELFELKSNDVLRNRVEIAIIIKAQEVLDKNLPGPSDKEVEWAKEVLRSTSLEANSILLYILARNKNNKIVDILNESDSTLQQYVDKAIDVIISGGIV